MTVPERLLADYAGTSLTIGPHPMSLRRPELALRGVLRASDLSLGRHGRRVRVAGAVITRQRPGTAKGFVFVSLEDETGISNAVVAPPMFEANRLMITEESFLVIEGKVQNVDNVIHIKAEKIERLDHGTHPGSRSYDFH